MVNWNLDTRWAQYVPSVLSHHHTTETNGLPLNLRLFMVCLSLVGRRTISWLYKHTHVHEAWVHRGVIKAFFSTGQQNTIIRLTAERKCVVKDRVEKRPANICIYFFQFLRTSQWLVNNETSETDVTNYTNVTSTKKADNCLKDCCAIDNGGSEYLHILDNFGFLQR